MKKILMLFLMVFFANSGMAQNTPNDCVNAIVVCGNGNFSSNASGIGNIQEVSGCGGFEHNSIWLKINIVQSGTLGFDLIPNDPNINVDYDFWVYPANSPCNNLGSPIRCATSNPQLLNASNNHTGMNLGTTATQVGPGSINPGNGNGYVRSITVAAGQFYYIAIDRPVGDGGFEIQWTGTATANTGAFPTPPTANQIQELKTCSNTSNIGIFDLNAVRSQINSNLAANTISFYTSFANAVDGLSPLPNIIANTSNPQTIYAKVVNNVSGCNTITDFSLRVYPVPDANISISDTHVCSGEIVTTTFTGTPGATVEYKFNNGPIQTVLLDAMGTFQITGPITADATYTLVSAQIVDGNNATVCSQVVNDTVSVIVSAVSAPTLSTNSPICEGQTAVLTFSGLANSVITYTVNIATPSTVTLDATGQAQVNLASLPSGSNQIIISNITDANAPNCSLSLNITETIQVNGQITTAILATSNVCQNAASPQVTFTGFGGIPPYIFVYKINNGANQTVTTTSGNSISVNVDTNVPGTFLYELVSVASTITPTCVYPQTGMAAITVDTAITPQFTQYGSICSGATLAALPTISNNGITGTWSPALNNSATTTYLFTPATGECASTTNMTITVNPNVTPIFTQVPSICSGGALSALPTTSNNGITGTWSPALNNLATTIYIFTPTTGLCAVTASMTITVITVTPTFTQVAPVCSGGILSALPTTSNNGIIGSWSPALNNLVTTTYVFTPVVGQCAETVSMTIVVNPLVTPAFTQAGSICSGGNLSALPTTSMNGIVGSWSPALNNAVTTIYTFTPAVGQCATTASMTIAVTSKPIVSVTNNTASICSGNAVDITLSCVNLPNAIIHWQYPSSVITGGLSGSGTGPIHLTDILTLSNSISVPTTITLTVYAEEGCRGDEAEVNIVVNPLPKPMISDGYICIDANGNVISDYVLNTGLSNADHTFVWYYNGNVISGATSSTYTVDQISEVGQYSVEAANTATTCESIRFDALVESSDAAGTATYVVSNYFEDNQSIIISVVGSGTYLYSLDGGPFQESNVFSSVPAGEHFVAIHDANGCTDITIEHIFTIGYPHFFTPNGDGYHDTWNIWSLPDQRNAEIHIFDRLGKLIKQIKPEGEGWDGTFNGKDLPSTDYWFTVKFNENQAEKIFKAHFSLKR